ncbi:MAG: TonB-dependent receptor [Caulobacter sp.]|nr:TonB-dependent receptor [Caulobacter sp.]
MTKTMLLATAAALLTTAAAGTAFAAGADATPQAAQAPIPTGPTATAPLDDTAQKGVLVFTPDFFAAQRPNTALDMVERVPGFTPDDGSGARGFEGAVGNILINNNRPASKNDQGTDVLERTPAGQVDRIELIRGGAPGIDMQGYSVVVNVILKTAASRQSIVTWNAMLFDGGKDIYGGSYQFTAKNGDRSWSVLLSDGTSSSDSNGPGRDIVRDAAGNVISDLPFANDGYGGGDSIRGNYSGPLAGGKLEATAQYGIHDWQEWQEIGVTGGPDRNYSDYAEDTKSGELGLTYIRPIKPKWTLETRLIHHFERFDEVATGSETVRGVVGPEARFTTKGDSSESIVRALVRNERSEALTFEAGGEVAYNMLDTNQAYSEGGVAIDLPSASVKVEELRGEAFVKGTWRVNPRLTLEGGLRLETSTIKQSGDASAKESFFYPKPRFQATWTPRTNYQLRYRFERELGQLDFNDFVASSDFDDGNVHGGNVDLRPEQRWINEVTFERRFWGEGIVSIGYRHDEIIDVVDWKPLDDGLSAVGNIGDGTLDRLSLNIVVPTDKFGIKGGRFTFKNDWNETHVKDPTTHQDRPISSVRPTQANIGFQQDITAWKTQWGVNWLPLLGRGDFYPDQSGGWRGAQYWEAFVEYKPQPSLSLRAQINLWNDFEIYRTVYKTREEPREVDFSETRQINPRTFVTLKLRKTF